MRGFSIITAILIHSILSDQVPFITPSLSSYSDSPLLSHSFSTFAKNLLVEFGVPGVAVGVIKLGENGGKDKVEYYSFGTAGKSGDVTEDTLFGIASNSKVFTSAAVGILVDEGIISWNDKISSLLPELGFKDSITMKEASLIDVLAHQTGLPRHEHSYQIGESHEDFVRRIQYLRPSSEFREGWQYNNQMFITAAYLVSKFTSTPFTTFIQENIFAPLKMSSSTYHPIRDHSPTLSDSYVTLSNGTYVEIPYGFDFDEEGIELAAGAGGIVSSTRDMVKWMEFLIKQRQAAFTSSPSSPSSPPPLSSSLNSILSSSQIRKISIGHSIQSQTSTYPEQSAMMYGLGLGMGSYRGVEVVKHGGDVPGFGSQVQWSSEKGFGVVALTNAAGSGNAVADAITYRVIDELLGLEPVNWAARYRAKQEASAHQSESCKYQPPYDVTPPSLPLRSYLGKYFDEGYGSIEVCPTRHSHSSTCSQLLETLSTALPSSNLEPPTTSTGPPLIISFPGFFGASHILLHHHTGNIYRGTFANVFAPIGERKESLLDYDREKWDEVEVRFGLEGMGRGERVRKAEMKGIWGEGEIVRKMEKEKVWGKGGRVEVRFLKEEEREREENEED